MTIEEYKLEKDIHVFGVTADSFPDGVLKAHQKLHAMLQDVNERNFYGISCPDKTGRIIYHAAVEEKFKDEEAVLPTTKGMQSLILKKGKYVSVFLRNYTETIENISTTFGILLKDPRIDPQGYCVENYIGEKDLRCMVRLQDHYF